MFSSSQQTYVQSLVNSMKKEGFRFYVAHTYTNLNNNVSTPDLYIYFSRSEIVANSAYSFYIPEDSVLFTIRSGNYSNYYGNNTDRVVRSEFSGNINISVYEHIYTNSLSVEGEILQPSVYIEGSDSVALLGVSSILLSISLIFSVFWKMWKIH